MFWLFLTFNISLVSVTFGLNKGHMLFLLLKVQVLTTRELQTKKNTEMPRFVRVVFFGEGGVEA